jgi:DNA repair ATPase RecN
VGVVFTVSVIGVKELPEWFAQQTEELLSGYRVELRRQLDRIDEAFVKSMETSDLLLGEVLLDGEMTVPGAAQKLASQLKSSIENISFPEQLTYSTVDELIADLEGYLRETMMSGRRYIPRLPPVHKKIVKELDYQIRAVDQGYRKIRKIWEKGKVPKQLDTIETDVKEIVQRSDQLMTLVDQLQELKQQQKETAGRVETQREGIDRFRAQSGLDEIDAIRTEIDSIRMLVTNQLNFLKKPFKKLDQAAGTTVMISSLAGEGANSYSSNPWEAFQKDEVDLAQLKAGLRALANAIGERKLSFKQSLNRKILDRQTAVCEQGGLDKYRQRFGVLDSRKNELNAAVSVEDRRELEKSLDRAQWEHRDVTAEINHSNEQIERIAAQLKTLRKRLESSLSRLVREDITLEFPDEVQTILVEGVREDAE